jgi:hypothetical protein
MENTLEKIAKLSSHLSVEISEMLSGHENELNHVMNLAYQHNPWFTIPNQVKALSALSEMLSLEKITKWLKKYSFPVSNPRNVGIILAGNIPAVGFHDILCLLISGHKAIIKCSSSDNILMQWLAKQLASFLDASGRIVFSDRLKGVDAVIATGTDHSAMHFDYYFSKIPRIIRRNRNAVAILQGNESQEDLAGLCSDIFSYFGLGCRNVSKIYVPSGYSFDLLFQAFRSYDFLMEHNKYMNNYDYHRAVYLLNKEPFLTNNFVILKEAEQISSPVSVLHYQFYENEASLRQHLEEVKEKIQCIVSSFPGDVPFGKSQQPEPWDYADGVDTLQFLAELGR